MSRAHIGRVVIGAMLCAIGLVSMTPGIVLIAVGKRIADERNEQERWRSYLTHPASMAWARRTVGDRR